MRSYKKAGWYELSLPDQWEVDEEDSPVAIWQPDGAGALQITAEQLPHHKSGDEMDCFLALRAFLSSVGHELDESSARRNTVVLNEAAVTSHNAINAMGPVGLT